MYILHIFVPLIIWIFLYVTKMYYYSQITAAFEFNLLNVAQFQ